MSFSYGHNHHQLAVAGNSALLDVLSFEGHESLSQPSDYAIRFTSTDKTISPHTILMQQANFTLCDPKTGEVLRTLHGVITGFSRLSVSADEAHYSVRLQPRLALLSRSHQTRFWQDMSVPQIVENILRERHGMRGQDFLFSLSQESPRREQVMQYAEDDLTFIRRILAEVGIWFRFTTDARLNIDVVAFCDSRQGYQHGLTLPAVPVSGMHDSGAESVWAMYTLANVVTQSVTTRNYNYRDALADMDAQADVTRDDSTTYGEAYHYADNYARAGDGYQPVPESESGVFYARLHHERALSQQTRMEATTSSVLPAPGVVLSVTGDAPEAFSKGMLITGLTSRAARDAGLVVTLDGIPAGADYAFRPPLVNKPVLAGVLPARITSTQNNAPYAHIDKHGRYKVQFNADRDTWPQGEESLWVRQSRPYAGDTYGMHLPLLAGTEVHIAFENGDPDRPYITGVMHDSSHPDPVTIRNDHRNILRTPSGNEIRLDDTRDKEHIRITTEYGGKSQLSLGHIVDDSGDSQSQNRQRGEGFELRTDSYGAVRAAKGLFVTADGQPEAQGKQPDMAAMLAELREMTDEVAKLSADAATATANPADMAARLSLMNERVSELNAAVIAMHAPDGVALTSGGHLQLSAKANLMADAGRNADISVKRNLFLGIGDSLSAFVRRAGMKLIANQGAVRIEAQHDQMALLARKSLSIVSTEDEIKLSAKKITLNGGGSYITLDAHAIESGTSGEYRTRASHYSRRARAKMPVAAPESPVSEPGRQKKAEKRRSSD